MRRSTFHPQRMHQPRTARTAMTSAVPAAMDAASTSSPLSLVAVTDGPAALAQVADARAVPVRAAVVQPHLVHEQAEQGEAPEAAPEVEPPVAARRDRQHAEDVQESVPGGQGRG